jgi:putative zinc- or iron-chelating protein
MSQQMEISQNGSSAEMVQMIAAAAGEVSPATDSMESLPNSLEDLRNDVAEGLMYSHSRENANTSKVLEVASFSYALIELLMERGLISVEELDERKRQVGQRLAEKFAEKGMGVALTDDEKDKYACEGAVQIDCENRLVLCRGACCRLRFALTVQDLEEGAVKWELGRPYMIRHDADGYCHHVERETKSCGIYDKRPIVCRSYDCRKDKRIWADFENRIVSPDLENLFPKPSPPDQPQLYQLSRTIERAGNGDAGRTFVSEVFQGAGFHTSTATSSVHDQNNVTG